ncbi:MAG: hypothetical protein ABSE25_06925 [Syntrophorhabdales bacterium]
MEMKSQVGDLACVHGVATRGLLVRHLVLPGGLAGSRRVIGWIAETLGPATAISLMSQYYPTYRAGAHPLLREKGLENVFVQEMSSPASYRPDFTKKKPFRR